MPGAEGLGKDRKGHEGTFGVMKMTCFPVLVVTQVYTFGKTQPTVHSKWVGFSACQLYPINVKLFTSIKWINSRDTAFLKTTKMGSAMHVVLDTLICSFT